VEWSWHLVVNDQHEIPMRSYHFPGRSPTIARNAMAATSHPLATLTAIECLKRGGNAIDAAVTATALLCVVEPAMTGFAGDCFALLHKPGKGLIALNGSGRAPAAATPEWFAKAGISTIEVTSPHAVTVPGSIDAWATLLRDHGTLSLADALAPAIEAAEGGFAVAPRVAHDWAGLVEKISKNDGAKLHLLKEGRAPRMGEIMRFPALAQSLKLIAKDGPDAFYRGALMADMVADLTALGGLHTAADFAAQRSTYVEPIAVTYRGVTLHELPPNNQGVVALMILKILDRFPDLPRDINSAERLHVMMEAARLAYAARDVFVADPAMADVPVAHMLSDAFADTLAKRIDRKHTRADLGPVPRPQGTDTTYLTVADKNGMVVSFINSLFAGFGSGIVTKKTGFTMQNRGSGFSLQTGHPNCIAPGKRPMHTLVPAIATRDAKPWLSFGVMGGAYQPLGHVAVLSNRLDCGLDLQQAVDAPRLYYEDGKLRYEASLDQQIRAQLEAMGHPMAERPDPFGGAQAIELDHANGVLIGASDPRKDGLALGY
jgi:gamma-glutamyltranspeptidase / glutathione hydrolase